MSRSPGNISTEPLLGTPGNVFSPPLVENVPQARHEPVRSILSHLPPAPSPNQRVSGSHKQSSFASEIAPTTLQQPSAPIQPQFQSGGEWNEQLDQLRNDLFGIAMSVSALNDRLDRLEQRSPAGAASAQDGIATLRSEIETWLENHLNSAVEHCMRRILTRTSHPISQSAS